MVWEIFAQLMTVICIIKQNRIIPYTSCALKSRVLSQPVNRVLEADCTFKMFYKTSNELHTAVYWMGMPEAVFWMGMPEVYHETFTIL